MDVSLEGRDDLQDVLKELEILLVSLSLRDNNDGRVLTVRLRPEDDVITLNHQLEANVDMWIPVRQRSAATVYEESSTNTTITFRRSSEGEVNMDVFLFRGRG